MRLKNYLDALIINRQYGELSLGCWKLSSDKRRRLRQLADSRSKCLEFLGFALLCIDVFALESVGVVSAASHLDDLVEASAVTKNHSAISSAFHNL